MKNTVLCAFAAATLAVCISNVSADEVKAASSSGNNPPKKEVVYKKSKKVEFLIMTSNYLSPSILAELARKEAKCPYILFPAKNTKGDIVVIMPEKKDSFTIDEADLSKFIAFMNPQNVVFLGNEDFVSKKHRLALPPRMDYTNISNTNWNINAIILSNLLQKQDIAEKYKKAYAEESAKPKAVIAAEQSVAEQLPAAEDNESAKKNEAQPKDSPKSETAQPATGGSAPLPEPKLDLSPRK